MPPISRRELLRTGGVFALGMIAVACGKQTRRSDGTTGVTIDDVLAGRAQTLAVDAPGFEILSAREERLAFGLSDPSRQRRFNGGSGSIWLATSRTVPAIGPVPVAYRGEGLGARGIYVARVRFPADGQWIALVEATPEGAPVPLVGGGIFTVGKRNAMPKPGEQAISVATPTIQDHRGVDPICTRKPPCSMHGVSLDRALGNGKPTVFIIATPAFCQSRLCGPEVDIVQDVSSEVGDRANFIHLEVLKDDDPSTIARFILSPQADEWRLEEEPVIYFIGSSGTIAERIVGPADRSDVRTFTHALLA